MALSSVPRFRSRAADSASVPLTTSLMALATCANTGTFAPAASSGVMSFLRRKSPTASGLPAMARRRTSFADSSIKARLMVGCGLNLVSEPDNIALGHDTQGLGTESLRVEIMMEADQHDLIAADFFREHRQQ